MMHLGKAISIFVLFLFSSHSFSEEVHTLICKPEHSQYRPFPKRGQLRNEEGNCADDSDLDGCYPRVYDISQLEKDGEYLIFSEDSDGIETKITINRTNGHFLERKKARGSDYQGVRYIDTTFVDGTCEKKSSETKF